MADRALALGESTTMTVFVHEADGEELSFVWAEDTSLSITGQKAISSPNAQTITWKAPDTLQGSSSGQSFNIHVTVTDASGNSVWVFDEISVYDSIETDITSLQTPGKNACGGSSATEGAAYFLPLLGVGLLFRRRARLRESAKRNS